MASVAQDNLRRDIGILHRQASYEHIPLHNSTSKSQAFVTITFLRHVTEDTAKSMVKQLFHEASRKRLKDGSPGLETHIHYTGNYDVQPVRGVWHFHLMVECEDKRSFSKVAEVLDWLSRSWGDIKSLRYDEKQGAAGYTPLKHEHPVEGWGCPRKLRQCRKKHLVCRFEKNRRLWDKRHDSA